MSLINDKLITKTTTELLKEEQPVQPLGDSILDLYES